MKKLSILALLSVLVFVPELMSQSLGLGLSVLNVRNKNDFSFTVPGISTTYETSFHNIFSNIYLSAYMPVRTSREVDLQRIWIHAEPKSIPTNLRIAPFEAGILYNYYFLGKPGDDFAFGAFSGGSIFTGFKKYEYAEEYDKMLYREPFINQGWKVFMFAHPKIGLVCQHKFKSGSMLYRFGYNMGIQPIDNYFRDEYLLDFNSFSFSVYFVPSGFVSKKRQTPEAESGS